ncbi:flagellar basal-body rod protein FlgF [Halomonas shantousis]
MDRILYTAASGTKQIMDRQAVDNHNLANISTPGFRAQLMAMRAVPVQGDGLATRVSAAATTPGYDFRAGNFTPTGRTLDVALKDNAWLAVQTPDGSEAYTRRGDLQVDSTGLLTVLDRPVMGEDGPIFLPLEANVTIGEDGSISVIEPGQKPDAIEPVARLKLVTPPQAQLQRGEDGLFRLPPPPGEDIAPPQPLDDQARLASGALEGSNFSATDAMVAMIDSSRSYDMQMKIIESVDENEQRANNILSLQG